MRTSRSALGLLSCLVGLALAAAVQTVGPLRGPPLYDGVVTVDPYKFLQPAGTEAGGAQGVSRTGPVDGGASPAIAVGTPEQPPQAQLIAAPDALSLPAGTTSLVVSIMPVAPAATPASGAIIGNVYRVAVVNQVGAAVLPAAGTQVTLALRDPSPDNVVQIELLTAGIWQPLATISAAAPGTYETSDLTAFGDFALVGSSVAGDSGSPLPLLVIALVLLWAAISVSRGSAGRARGAR